MTGSSPSPCARGIAGRTASPSRPRISASISRISPTTRSSRRPGPKAMFFVEGKLARFEVLDGRRVRYSWDKPNPLFLPALAQPRPVFIYAPAHYLKAFHARYAKKDKLAELAAQAKLRSWADLVQPRQRPLRQRQSRHAVAERLEGHHQGAGQSLRLRAQSLFPPRRSRKAASFPISIAGSSTSRPRACSRPRPMPARSIFWRAACRCRTRRCSRRARSRSRLPHAALADRARLLLCALSEPHDRGSGLAGA